MHCSKLSESLLQQIFDYRDGANSNHCYYDPQVVHTDSVCVVPSASPTWRSIAWSYSSLRRHLLAPWRLHDQHARDIWLILHKRSRSWAANYDAMINELRNDNFKINSLLPACEREHTHVHVDQRWVVSRPPSTRTRTATSTRKRYVERVRMILTRHPRLLMHKQELPCLCLYMLHAHTRARWFCTHDEPTALRSLVPDLGFHCLQ